VSFKVKVFLRILGIGVAAFMAVAIVQEWEYFGSTWFGGEVPQAQTSETDEAEAVGTVRQFLVFMEHFYGTGGDPRFAERIPASPAVVGGLTADVEYLRRNHRRQESQLQKMDVTHVHALGPDRFEVRSREFWIHRIFWLVGEGGEAEPPHSQVINAKYLVTRRSSGWRVEAWQFDEDPPSDDAGGDP
jgi:hypothetical protein